MQARDAAGRSKGAGSAAAAAAEGRMQDGARTTRRGNGGRVPARAAVGLAGARVPQWHPPSGEVWPASPTRTSPNERGVASRSKSASRVAGAANLSPPSAAEREAKAMRTSTSHPMTISWVLTAADGGGAADGGARMGHHAAPLGLCFCPGKRRVLRDGVLWDRDLGADLARLRDDFGVRTVLCLLSVRPSRSRHAACARTPAFAPHSPAHSPLPRAPQDYELRSLGVRGYAEAVRAAGLEFLRFEVVEMAPPDSVDAVRTLLCGDGGDGSDGGGVFGRLSAGRPVAIHCRGGVGRAGTIAACAYLELGVVSSADAAITLIRQRRCRTAVESARQERFVEAYAADKRRRRGAQ